MIAKVKIIGGLGNQLFQYFFARSLSINSGCKVELDISDFSSNKYTLHKLNINQLNLKLPFSKNKFNFSNLLLKNKKEEDPFKFDENIFKKKYASYQGYWQSYKYFEKNWHNFKDDINFEKFNYNFEILNEIKRSNSISVHIRRGDYIENSKTSQFHGNIKLNYYKNAINNIQNKIENSKFFFFSDDIEWVKNNFSDKKFYFVENSKQDLKTPFKDLFLMKNCKHNIIANSTFSWWGAWLNENNNKIVLAPKDWTTNRKTITTDLIPKWWHIA